MGAIISLRTGILGLIVLLAVFVTIVYNRDIKTARQKLGEYNAKAIETSFGKVTIASSGHGIPVLLIHGICGGYDQAYESARGLVGEGYRIIAPSRFGYPGSDMPVDASPAQQANAYSELLDFLDIDKAVVIAISAGGAPALRFALDYPEKVRALVLLSANVPVVNSGDDLVTGPPQFIYNDFPMWLSIKLAKPFFLQMFGVDKALYKQATEEERSGFDAVFNTMLPMRQRRLGIINDTDVTNPDVIRHNSEYVLESLKVPVLMLNATDDPMAKYANTVAACGRIPMGTLKTFRSGGHTLFGHGDEVKLAIDHFVKAN